MEVRMLAGVLLILGLFLSGRAEASVQHQASNTALKYKTWFKQVFGDRPGNEQMGDSNEFTYQCMKCICKVEGCESQIGKCRMDVGSLSCGPYQIKKPYWLDCGSPGTSWKSCTTQMACSETCVRAYMARYGRWCTGGREPTCKDYALIHNGGPRGCRTTSLGYWYRVKKCCDSHGGC